MPFPVHTITVEPLTDELRRRTNLTRDPNLLAVVERMDGELMKMCDTFPADKHDDAVASAGAFASIYGAKGVIPSDGTRTWIVIEHVERPYEPNPIGDAFEALMKAGAAIGWMGGGVHWVSAHPGNERVTELLGEITRHGATVTQTSLHIPR